MDDKKCADVVKGSLASTMEDLRTLWELYCTGDEDGHEDLGNFHEYGLCFDYVCGDEDGPGYWRYQLSYGGPSTEFRFYSSIIEHRDHLCYRVEYWHLDWFDGAHLELSGDDRELMNEIWEWFHEGGSVHHAYDEAISVC